MSSRKEKTAPRQEAIYVYGIGEAEALSGRFDHDLPEAIEPAMRLELVTSSGLAAIISCVPREDYTETRLEENLNNAEWTATRAVRHQNVLTHFSARNSLIPLRFGTIYWSRERVEELLNQEAQRFQRLLNRLRDKDEWGLNLYADHSKLREQVVSLSPKLQELSRQAESAPPGRAYLLQKQVQSLRAGEARAKVQEAAEQIELRLRTVSDDITRLQGAGWGKAEPSALSIQLAFLVAKPRLQEFRDMLELLAREYATLGLHFELTGPWPAYNFVSATITNQT